MPYPSIRTLETAFPGLGKPLRSVLTDKAEAKRIAADHPQREYARKVWEIKLMACDLILQTCGIEYIASCEDSWREAQGVSYANNGDSYAPTVCYDHRSGLFKVRGWADWVETDPKRFEAN